MVADGKVLGVFEEAAQSKRAVIRRTAAEILLQAPSGLRFTVAGLAASGGSAARARGHHSMGHPHVDL